MAVNDRLPGVTTGAWACPMTAKHNKKIKIVKKRTENPQSLEIGWSPAKLHSLGCVSEEPKPKVLLSGPMTVAGFEPALHSHLDGIFVGKRNAKPGVVR